MQKLSAGKVHSIHLYYLPSPRRVRSPPRLRPPVGRRDAIAAAEGAVEIGQIAEAGVQRERADAALGAARICEQPMGAHQPLLEHELGERGAVALEQLADID